MKNSEQKITLIWVLPPKHYVVLGHTCPLLLRRLGFFVCMINVLGENSYFQTLSSLKNLAYNRVSLYCLSSLYMNKQGQSLLSVLDTESPVLEGACQSHLRGAPGYITPVSLTSPLRSYFSNVQSALWLLCSSSPSSSHCHSTSKVMFQKPSAISPTKASQKLQIHSPRHLRHGPGLCKGPCHATLYPGLLSPVLLGPDHLTGGLRVILPSGLQRRA